MPFLMVDLDDSGDCQRAMRQLRRHLRQASGEQPEPLREQTRRSHGRENSDRTPLRQKLQRIRQRGVWRFLVQIARLDDSPRSLSELDEALDLPRNKMRSTKAIFAKLENRLDVRFLKPADDAGEDESGNPRYMMPPRVRKLILELAD